MWRTNLGITTDAYGHDFVEFTGERPTATLTPLETAFGERLSAMRSANLSEDTDGNSRVFF
jgi:hypothetical protein